MRLLIDISGKKFGRLSVIGSADEARKSIGRKWKCLCDCGNVKLVSGSHLRSGAVISCGCLNRENTSSRSRTHGRSGCQMFNTWRSMIYRCHNTRSKEYPSYGGRGIYVCTRWLTSIDNFIEDMGERPKGFSIDRIDNDGPYEKQNCRWASKKEQSNNRRNTSMFDGVPATVWAERLGIDRSTAYRRIIKNGNPFGKYGCKS